MRRVVAGELAATTSLLMLSRPTRANDPGKLKHWWDHFEMRDGLPRAGSARNGDVRIVDLFCGCGGLALGASRAAKAIGLHPVISLAADSDPDALGVYARNLAPERLLSENLWSLVEFQIRRTKGQVEFAGEPVLLHPALRALVGKADLVIGGPPCQGHSNFNNVTRRMDPRNLLYLVPLAVAAALGARAVVVENVPGVIHDRFAQVAGLARDLARSIGYRVDDAVVNALELGVPQTRRRHILVCSREGVPNISSTLDALRRSQRSVEFALRDLLSAESSTIYDQAAALSPDNQRRVAYLFRRGLYDLPPKARPDCHKNGTTYISVYGRLNWKLPAGTITTGFMSPGRGRFIHPELPRTLTAHEAARLQAFPDDFRFDLPRPSGKKKALAKLIGDAVPPPLGYAAALAAFATLKPAGS